jgi:hypothetical protein
MLGFFERRADGEDSVTIAVKIRFTSIVTKAT